MPLPTPKKGESMQQFIDRCMGDKKLMQEFPDNKQRYAVLMNLFKDKGGGKK